MQAETASRPRPFPACARASTRWRSRWRSSSRGARGDYHGGVQKSTPHDVQEKQILRGVYPEERSDERAQDEDDNDEDVYEMEVTLEQSDVVLYAFRDIEDVISVCKQLKAANIVDDGRLYAYNGRYMLAFEPVGVELARYHAIIALLAEYGEATSITTAVLDEYGKLIIGSDVVSEICTHF